MTQKDIHPTYPKPPSEKHVVFDILDLTTLERNILITTWNMGKDLSSISRAISVPRTSLLYSLKKLQKRRLIKLVPDGGSRGGYWKCNIPHIARHFRALAWPRS